MTAMVAAMVAAVMSTVMPAKAPKSISAMATMVPTTEPNERKAVTIEPTPPIMAAVVSTVMAVPHLLNHA